MATKRGFCNTCQCKKIEEHYFVVNADAKVCYCPSCMKKLNPEEAIHAYEKHVDGLLHKADFTLYEQNNPILAYHLYAEILEFEKYNTLAFLGRLICLLCMSKVRHSYINDMGAMLEKETDQYHKPTEVAKYVQALMKMNNVVDQYEDTLKKKLTFKGYFYDVDCLKLYFKHLNEIIAFKEILYKEAKTISKKFHEQKAQLLINLLDVKIDEQTATLNDEEYITALGDHYKFEKIKRNGEVEITQLPDKHTDTKLYRYRLSTLDPNNKKCRYIDDVIFKDYTRVIKLKRASIYFILSSLLLAGGCALVAYFFHHLDYVFYPVLIAGAVLLGSMIAWIVLRFRWSRQLRQKKKNQLY